MVEQRRDQMADEDFKPIGTVVIVVLFTLTLILLWVSVYLILLARGVTV